jgi:hypothetical protein
MWQPYARNTDSPPTSVCDGRAARCLRSDSLLVMRRVYDFPRTWVALSDAELLAVSWRR